MLSSCYFLTNSFVFLLGAWPSIHPLRLSTARKQLREKKLKLTVKQNILNVKRAEQWQCLTVLDLMPTVEATVESDSYPWLVKHFPISPPCLRPACQTVGSKKSISHNDLTHRLGSLIRIDKGIRKMYEMNPDNTDELKRLLARLQLAFTLLFFPPPGQRESRELSCLTDRLKGKDGRMRLTLLGKRIEFSGRSPISGDIYLDLDEVGVPRGISKKLTLPEYVTDFNKEHLSRLLFRNEVKIIQRGNQTMNPKYGGHSLMVGDICHRYIQDGDMVMLNRQPSLWSSSVQAFRARVFDSAHSSPSSIRLNVEM